MVQVVGFSCLDLQLLYLSRVPVAKIVCHLRQQLNLKAGCCVLEGFAHLEVFEWILSVLGGRLVILHDKRQVTEVPQLNLGLVHFKSSLQAIIFIPLRLLENVHDAVLYSFPGFGHRLLENLDSLSHEGNETCFHDLLHLGPYFLPITCGEYPASDLARGWLCHGHLHINEIPRIQINVLVNP